MIQELFKHLNIMKESKENIQSWVNRKNDEGFCAIHFASFKGNIVILLYLVMLNNIGIIEIIGR